MRDCFAEKPYRRLGGFRKGNDLLFEALSGMGRQVRAVYVEKMRTIGAPFWCGEHPTGDAIDVAAKCESAEDGASQGV
jgi:hypothetical protein